MENEKYLYSEITGKILQVFFRVYTEIGYGFDKAIYINSLQIELQKVGLKSESNKQMEIYYQGIRVGHYTADIVVENSVLLKICNNDELSTIDEQILFNHLKVNILQVGLLLNFGLTPQHKRKIFTNDIKTNPS